MSASVSSTSLPQSLSVDCASPTTTNNSSNYGDCSSAGSGITTASSISSGSALGLPSSAHDGKHLHWKTFRQDVLAPHQIFIAETPSQALPDSLIALIEASQANKGKFEQQKNLFRAQVVQGRGFGPSPLFPPNLLPPIDDEPRLARCMVPSFSREPLPHRAARHGGPFYELSIPKSGLGCGFSHKALTAEEAAKLPRYLVPTGTVVHFDTGYIAPGASLYCPFLVFERTFGQKEYRLETASNHCAIVGAWCTRSLQLLYAQAWADSDKNRPSSPVSFSCTIDNGIAIINYHWISTTQEYCMSPVCKFLLSNDEHFSQFNIWVEAIGQWGMRTLLPDIKRALACVSSPSPGTLRVQKLRKPDLRIDTKLREEKLVTALKTSFGNIPWRLDDGELDQPEDVTHVPSSSIASWGSPIIHESYYNNLEHSPILQTAPVDPISAILRYSKPHVGHRPQPTLIQPEYFFKLATPITPAVSAFSGDGNSMGDVTPPPLYATNSDPESVWQKRFGQAVDEIQTLQTQLQRLQSEMSGLSVAFQTELAGLRNTVATVLRKERTSSNRPRSSSNPIGLSLNTLNLTQKMKDQSISELQQTRQGAQSEQVITTPTDPNPRRPLWDRPRPARARSSLQQVMTVDTNTGISTALETMKDCDSATIKEDKPIIREISLPTPIAEDFSASKRALLTPGPLSSFSVRSDSTNVVVVPPHPPRAIDLFKWSGGLLGVQALCFFIPSTLIRFLVLGCVTDFALFAFISPHWPSTVHYLTELFGRPS